MKIWIDKELFQWEKNRHIFIETMEEEPAISHVQFYNKKSAQGREVPLENNKAKIPNELLKDCFPIMVVACNGERENAWAIGRREFKVIKRAKPESYIDDSEDKIEIIYDGGMEI